MFSTGAILHRFLTCPRIELENGDPILRTKCETAGSQARLPVPVWYILNEIDI